MAFEEREKKTLNKRAENFIQQGRKKYGEDTYDYSLAREEYVTNRIPVHLICNRCNSKPFLVYPFMHTSKGKNQKGSCTTCYKSNLNVQETRWDPNLPARIQDFRDKMTKRHGEDSPYSYPHLDKEYKNEDSIITVQCSKCRSKPYPRMAKTLKDKSRYAGCAVCNRINMAETIKVQNTARQLRNQKTKDVPREYGCIYKIINTKNEKFYIGYTTLSAKKRFKSHVDETRRMQKNYKGKKSYLHNAMDKHGIECFKVEILKEFTDVTPLFLAELEMEYIAKLKPQYNLSPGGEIGRSKDLQ